MWLKRCHLQGQKWPQQASANSVDPDKTAPEEVVWRHWRSSLIRVYTVCHSVPNMSGPSTTWKYHNELNPHLPNGLSHPHQLDESIFHFRGVWCTFFQFLFLIEIPVSKQCRPWLDAVFCGSDLGLHCLPMSQKWDARLIWVKYRDRQAWAV